MAVGSASAGGPLSWQFSGALVSHAGGRRRQRAKTTIRQRSGWRTEITRMQLKSVIARVRKERRRASGTRIRAERWDAVEIGRSADRRRAVADGHARILRTRKYSWKLFTYRWEGATPGEHTLVSRATDVEGKVQPVAAELKPEEDVPRRQRAISAQSHDWISSGDHRSASAPVRLSASLARQSRVNGRVS